MERDQPSSWGRMCKVRAAPGSLKSLPNADRVGGADQAQDPRGSWQGLQRLREEQKTQAGVCSWRERLGSQRTTPRGVRTTAMMAVSLHPNPLSPGNLREQPAVLRSQGLHPELPKNQAGHTTHQTCPGAAEQAFSAAETSGGQAKTHTRSPKPHSSPTPGVL